MVTERRGGEAAGADHRRPRRGHEPRTGGRRTLVRTIREFQEDELTDWAAALTYYAILSIFPALIALVSIVGLLFEPREITDALTDVVARLGPESAVEAMTGPIETVAEQSGDRGVALLILGILLALWSASSYVGGFVRASNRIYEVDEGRPIWKLRPLQLLITLVMVLLLALIVVAVIVTGPLAEAVGGALGVGDTAVLVWDVVKWPVIAVVVLLMLAVLYYAAPNAKVAGFRFVTVGSVVAVVIWGVASALFAFYVSGFGSYDKTYGTLGGVIAFLVWMWITNVAVLLGAELNAERERTRQLDAHVPGAAQRLQLEERDPADDDQRPRTA